MLSRLAKLGGKYTFFGKARSPLFGELNGSGALRVKAIDNQGHFSGVLDFYPKANLLFFPLRKYPINGLYQEGKIQAQSPIGEISFDSKIIDNENIQINGSALGFDLSGVLRKTPG